MSSIPSLTVSSMSPKSTEHAAPLPAHDLRTTVLHVPPAVVARNRPTAAWAPAARLTSNSRHLSMTTGSGSGISDFASAGRSSHADSVISQRSAVMLLS